MSVRPDSSRYVASVLAGSALATVRGPVPAVRPDRTPHPGGLGLAGYTGSNSDGDDGDPLTDYDVIGSAAEGRGIFALVGGPLFNFLYIPPLARETDIGASTLLVASRFCRDHRAMLIVDPPAAWDCAEAAVASLRDWPFASEHALMYFPRVLAFDKLRGRFRAFAPGAAVAGMIARAMRPGPSGRRRRVMKRSCDPVSGRCASWGPPSAAGSRMRASMSFSPCVRRRRRTPRGRAPSRGPSPSRRRHAGSVRSASRCSS